MTTPMNTSKDFLTALQWLSPAFPVGSFAYSHGLEWAISAGHVTQEAELLEWVRDLVQFGSGRNDAFLVSLGYQAHDIQALRDLNAQALALSASRERQAETVFQGQAFVKTLKENERGIAQGQAAVLYIGTRCIGGGTVISKCLNQN